MHCARDGASVFDLPRSRAEQDWEQWRPLTRWIARHAAPDVSAGRTPCTVQTTAVSMHRRRAQFSSRHPTRRTGMPDGAIGSDTVVTWYPTP